MGKIGWWRKRTAPAINAPNSKSDPRFPLWRMPDPENRKHHQPNRKPKDRGKLLYWSRENACWQEHGYTVWRNDEWGFRFKRHRDLGNGWVMDNQGRMWESYGYPIPLYDDDC